MQVFFNHANTKGGIERGGWYRGEIVEYHECDHMFDVHFDDGDIGQYRFWHPTEQVQLGNCSNVVENEFCGNVA